MSIFDKYFLHKVAHKIKYYYLCIRNKQRYPPGYLMQTIFLMLPQTKVKRMMKSNNQSNEQRKRYRTQ